MPKNKKQLVRDLLVEQVYSDVPYDGLSSENKDRIDNFIDKLFEII